jgi:hypothetical protein
MTRTCPVPVWRLGWATLLLGAAWLGWLLLGRHADVLDLLRAGFGDRTAAARLAARDLASGGAVFAFVLTWLLEVAVAAIWVAAGVGLLHFQPAARWAALFACLAAIPLEACGTLVQVFCLTAPHHAVKLVPVIVNGLVILGAVALWGGLFLPGVAAAYAGGPEGGARAG